MSTASKWFLLFCAPFLLGQAGAVTVSGTVSSHATGTPIAGATVYLARNHFLEVQTSTEPDGTYTLDVDVVPGSTYSVTAQGPRYIALEQTFDPASPEVPLDFSLLGTATISGHVQMPAGMPIGNTAVVLAWDWDWGREIPIQADGSFVADDVYPNAYRVCIGGIRTGILLQCFDHVDQTSPLSHPDYSPVVVGAEESRTGIDFDLSYGGSISGRFIDTHTGQPLAGYPARLRFFDANGDEFDELETTSLADGTYRARGFPPGDYYMMVASSGPFTDAIQIYPNLPCSAGDCDTTQGQRLTITGANEIANLDIAFHPSVIVHGRVVDATTGTGIAGAKINAYVLSWDPFGGTYHLYWSTTSHGSDGTYELYLRGGPGEAWGYPVAAEQLSPYIDTVYPDVPCTTVDFCLYTATRVSAMDGQTLENVNIHATLGASISGSVATTTGAPVPYAIVQVFDHDGHPVAQVDAGVDGTYATHAFVLDGTHTYYASAQSFFWPFPCSVYLAIDCPAADAPITSVNPTPIVLQVGQELKGIDFHMSDDGIFHGTFDP